MGRWIRTACAVGLAVGSGAADVGAPVRGAPLDVPIVIEGARGVDVLAQAAFSAVGAAQAALLATGSGVRVAILDGGFDLTHEALAGCLDDAWDAVDQDADPTDLGNAADDDADGVADRCVGHGTFVAGIVRACAPGVVIVPVRVLDDEGRATTAALARGIEHAVAAGADVINLSLVAPETSVALQEALDAAEASGVVIVTSAGNSPTGALDHAYLHARAITVGAVGDAFGVAAFSPTGTWVDVYAPGVDVLGPLVDDAYAEWSGTSFSCAFVAAAAALVREVDPGTSTPAMRSRLAAAVDPVTGAGVAGRGSIDLLLAVAE
jgi:subtilisin family serine protease